MLEHARQFIARVLPPPAEGAYLNIHWKGTLSDGKPFWTGRACTTVDEAVRTIDWVNKQGDKDLYVCMSLQAKYETKTSAKGNSYRKALRFADDVAQIRSLYVDVDVKEEGYPDTGAALEASYAFITSTGMPMPSAVVASGGGGFHMHWALDQDLTRGEWQVLADALQRAVQTFGLKCDSQCTVDSARILRIPGTFNRKYDPPRETELLAINDNPISLDHIRSVLAPYLNALPPRGTTKIAANDELGANLDTKKIEIKLGDVAKACPFVARSLGTGGKDNDQPLWFMTASIATFLEDGREALHAMSNQHVGYTVPATDELYDRVTRKQKTRDVGWPHCQKIASYGCKECQSCPHLAANKSPLNFVLAADNDEPDGELPDRYVRDKAGLINVRSVNEDGSQLVIPVCSYPIMTGWLSNNPWTLHFTTKTETGRKTVIEVPTEVITAKDSLPKFLGAKGFFCTEKQYKILKEFFVAWLQKLQSSKDSVISTAPFGWSVVDGKVEGFTFAGRVWMAGTDRPAANPNPVLQFQYTPKGEIAPWQELAKVVYEQNRPGLNAILAVAFAGPLVKFTGFPGLLLNAYSPESGIGKTTAMKASQAVWGHPVLAMQALNDTSNSVLNKMGQLRSLPVYWDELKSEQQVKRFVGIVFDLTGGREKTRLNADSTLKVSGTWQTMMVSASNESIVDDMGREVGSTTAGLHRMFEYQVEKPAQVTHDVGAVQRLAGKLEDNYGHAGLLYAKFLGSNLKRVEHEVAKLQDEICTEIRVRQEERMWAATITVLLKGAEYANELGLMQIDVPTLKEFLMGVLTRMRSEVDASPTSMANQMSVSSILAEFLNSTRARNTLLTNRIWTSKGKPNKGAIQILNDASKLSDIIVHIGRDDGLMRISSTYFSRWMADRKYSRHTLTQKLKADYGMKVVNGKLGGGTELTGAMEYLLELDMNHPELAALVG